MNFKKKIYTISYFDVNQKNGGAIFAKNMNTFLNETELFESEVYCNYRKVSVENQIGININFRETSLKDKIKNTLKASSTFELFIHFVRNDFNAFFLSLKLFLTNKIKRESILLFHDHLSLFYFSLFNNLGKCKLVMIMHNDGFPAKMVSSGLKSNSKRNLLNKITDYQIKSVINNVNKVVFLCDSARNNFINLYNIPVENTTTIPNGINSEYNVNKKKTDSSILEFITVCTMNERKGIDTFIECLPFLNEKYKSIINFTLIGQGPLLEDLKYLSSKHNNINVVGESNNVSEYLQNSDVFFLLSKNEGQPLSITEALSSSLFILATNVGCNESMVTEGNGILVDANQASVLEAFFNVIENWQFLKHKGQNSLDLYNKLFTEKKMYESYINIFKEL
jgi:glycosyltransferase involved in cell wall biosynthesis